MHFTLLKINPPDTAPSHGFDDVMLPLFFAFRRLGFSVELRINKPNPSAINIVFGSCIAPRRTGRLLPRNSIIYNLEQFSTGSQWNNRDYLAHLRNFTVWDYSERNIPFLQDAGVTRAIHVPLGYVPEMTRIRGVATPDIDVLFYGLVNERRHLILRSLLERGIRVLAAQNAFWAVRDALIARARIVLNIHYYLPASLEVARLGYLWANRKAVLCERNADSGYPDWAGDACAYYPYEKLVDGAEDLLGREEGLIAQAQAGFTAFSGRSLTCILAKIIGRRGKGEIPEQPEAFLWQV